MRISDWSSDVCSSDLNLAPSSIALTGQGFFDERDLEKRIAFGTDFTADTTRNLRGEAQVSLQPFQSMRASIGMNQTRDLVFPEIGRASCRERVCQYV